MSDWVQIHTDRLRLKLQEVVDGANNAVQQATAQQRGLRVPWGWACRLATTLLYSLATKDAVL